MSVTHFLKINIDTKPTRYVEDLEASEHLYYFLNRGRVCDNDEVLDFNDFLNEDEILTIKITDDLSPMDDEEDENGNFREVDYNWVSPAEYEAVLQKLKLALFNFLINKFKSNDFSSEPNPTFISTQFKISNFYRMHFKLIYDLGKLEKYISMANTSNSKIAFTVSDF